MVRGVVVIDPGHGGVTAVGGSSANNAVSFSGVLEKTMTLDLARLMREAIAESNSAGQTDIKVVLTRESDANLGLIERASLARTSQADRFLSIHFNGFDKNVRGVETLIRPAANGNVNHKDDKSFAARIQEAVFQTIKGFDPAARNRGVKDQKLGVLNDAVMGNTATHHPCRACLLEVEFIDVEAVDRLLNTNPTAAEVRRAIASALAGALIADLKG